MMLSLDAARSLLAESVKSLKPVKRTLSEVLNLRLAETVRSDIDLPHWDVSAMDGYAVHWKDLSRKEPLPVAFEVRAGDAPPKLTSGQTARINTGAVIPAGADTVIPREDAVVDFQGRVKLKVLPEGSFIRPRGEILKQGSLIGQPGDLLTPGKIALLAAGGSDRVSVIPPPRVAILMTGSELVPPGQQPRIGSIRDSNGPLLEALVRLARFPLNGKLTAPDDLKKTCKMLQRLSIETDLIITSGGVSVGDWDFVPRAIKELRGKILFHKVAIKPGKPVLAVKFGNCWVMGLPGNPVSVLVSWRMFALPLGLALSGDPLALRETPRQATLRMPVHNREDRMILQPAIVDDSAPEPIISPLPWKGSHDVAAAAQATALLRLEVGANHQPGDKVGYYPLIYREPERLLS